MSKKIDVDDKLIKKLAKLLDETGLSEIEYGEGEVKIRVSKAGTQVSHVAAPIGTFAAAADTGPVEVANADHPGVVTSPMVGVVYTAAEPDAPAMVNVGDTVIEGQVLLMVEAMKVFNQIKAPKGGTISKILIENGAPVEFGEPLLIIE